MVNLEQKKFSYANKIENTEGFLLKVLYLHFITYANFHACDHFKGQRRVT